MERYYSRCQRSRARSTNYKFYQDYCALRDLWSLKLNQQSILLRFLSPKTTRLTHRLCLIPTWQMWGRLQPRSARRIFLPNLFRRYYKVSYPRIHHLSIPGYQQTNQTLCIVYHPTRARLHSTICSFNKCSNSKCWGRSCQADSVAEAFICTEKWLSDSGLQKKESNIIFYPWKLPCLRHVI